MELVLAGLKDCGLRQIVLVDNGSTDRTAERAREAGAVVISEPKRGYGSACLAGLKHLANDPPDVVVFSDCDGADDPSDLERLTAPIRENGVDLVIGSRTRGSAEPGSLTPVQRFGNVLSCRLISLLFGVQFTDLGPYRAIRWRGLTRLNMADDGFGWTVEMQAKAARRGLVSVEIPVSYRRRHAGKSKVSGNLIGSVRAGAKILYTIGREALR